MGSNVKTKGVYLQQLVFCLSRPSYDGCLHNIVKEKSIFGIRQNINLWLFICGHSCLLRKLSQINFINFFCNAEKLTCWIINCYDLYCMLLFYSDCYILTAREMRN